MDSAFDPAGGPCRFRQSGSGLPEPVRSSSPEGRCLAEADLPHNQAWMNPQEKNAA